MADKELLSYLSRFDVFGLLETWECLPEQFTNIFPTHHCLFCPAVRSSRFGRAMSGTIVYVKNELMKYVKRLYQECNFGIFLLFDKTVFGLDKNIVICFIYLPPDHSPFYVNTDLSGIALLENRISKLEALNEDVDLIILGDLNARTAERNDFIQDKNIVPALEEYEPFLNDDMTKRTSCDKQVNKFGLELLEFCKTYMIRICNGRKGRDQGIGNFTFIGAGGNSVIDYILCSDSVLDSVYKFDIEDRTESSHFPVSMSMQCLFRIPEGQNISNDHEGERRFYKFNNVTSERYRENVSYLLTNEFIHNFILMIQDESMKMSVLVEHFLNIFYQCGSCCISVIKEHSRTQPKWFDETCKKLKHEKYRALRQYRRLRTQYNLSLYKDARQAFKTCCSKQLAIYNSKILDDLVSFQCNPKSFWNKLKNLTGPGKQRNNITKDQWKTHFESLFAGGELDEDINNQYDSDDDVIYDATENELEDIIFNSEITNEEIVKAVQALKRGKSSGEDELIPEFFIHSMDLILPIVNPLFNRIFNTGDYPPSWGRSILVTLFKKGDINNPNDYRGI